MPSCSTAEDRNAEIGLNRLVKVAAKLQVIAWTLMKKGEAFEPDKFAP